MKMVKGVEIARKGGKIGLGGKRQKQFGGGN